jgi:polysaccharide export outer membrane protein
MRNRTDTLGLGFVLIVLVLTGSLWGQMPDPAAHAATASLTEAVKKAHDGSFVIGDDDVLAVNVWKEPDISRSIPVRSDGRISLPLVGNFRLQAGHPYNLRRT